MPKDYLETGKVVGTHGVRGELRVQAWCDSPDFLVKFKRLYLSADGSGVLEILSARAHGNLLLVKAKGVDTIGEAERLRGKILYLRRGDVTLEEGRYFVQDLIGCRVLDADSEEPLGTVTGVSQTGANDVWHIAKDGKEYLIPAIPDVVLAVDTEAGRVVIRPLKGIFDDAD